MEMLSEDDLNLQGMTLAELEAAWDLWFDLAQYTNDFDPPYTHGVFQNMPWTMPADPVSGTGARDREAGTPPVDER